MSMSRQLGDRSVFDRTHGPAVGASGDGLEGAYSAILNSAPSGGAVKVIVPNLWGLTTVRTAVCSLAFTGSPGNRVLVVFDEEKQPWVVENLATAPPPAPIVTVARAYRNGALSIPINTSTKVPMDTKSYDPGGCFDTTINFRYNAPVTGYYQVNASLLLLVSATGTYTEIAGWIYKNGVSYTEIVSEPAVESYVGAWFSDIIPCNAGDYLELFVYVTPQTATLLQGAQYNYLSIVQVGP
jgi:hypothetical protein